MKKNLPMYCIVFVLLFLACTKSASDTDEVLIRIENATTNDFTSFRLNATEFGSITGGDTSKYLLCRKILPAPFANEIAINNNYLYILDIVPTPYLKNGRYLMKVVSDTLPDRYKATFIKE